MSTRIGWQDLPAPKPSEAFAYYLHRVQVAFGRADPLIAGAAAERFADHRRWAAHNAPEAVLARRERHVRSQWERLEPRRVARARRDVAFQRFLTIALMKPKRRKATK